MLLLNHASFPFHSTSSCRYKHQVLLKDGYMAFMPYRKTMHILVQRCFLVLAGLALKLKNTIPKLGVHMMYVLN